MIEFLAMGGQGAYVWSAYGITLAALIYNYWSAERRLRDRLREARRATGKTDGPRTPTVRQL